jgi:hypothetical protein
MPSFVWQREPQEAFSNPYEYAAQEQFVREATSLLDLLHVHFAKKDRRFHRDDVSVEKAVWMLQVDSLEALKDALVLTEEKRHRMACRLFRDALETQDLSFYFATAGEQSNSRLHDWFADEVVPHRIAREYVKSVHGTDRWEALRDLYGALSKYTHRTYHALGKSYILGQGDILVYDGFREGTSLVLPHVVSFSYAVLAMLIDRFIEIALATGELPRERVDSLRATCLERDSAPRRFVPVSHIMHYPREAKNG